MLTYDDFLTCQIEQLIALHELVTREERERGNLASADEEESDSAAMLHLLSPSRCVTPNRSGGGRGATPLLRL
eukprot:6198217-Pleurochrysis_carterae.AAC.1